MKVKIRLRPKTLRRLFFLHILCFMQKIKEEKRNNQFKVKCDHCLSDNPFSFITSSIIVVVVRLSDCHHFYASFYLFSTILKHFSHQAINIHKYTSFLLFIHYLCVSVFILFFFCCVVLAFQPHYFKLDHMGGT